ncbi:TPA: hypothetical protein STU63_003131 [Clostridioides difficile]|uniref:glycine rich domain-containing protein n=1 Tax=Clostridioides difficile TaxID=1496 RepID=UPI001C143D9B|nr:glycine-rich protein [Clostridioides difficile]MDK3209363.1 glycine-rich protein [Clostridioides difficile]MDL0186314.1 glycine-rich protein [Clostridioides difficile]MDL0190078.1 glycine-rich protein [Clostridioides difficile]HBF2208371.1 hypothetical protein [Clostridioides difficile]HBG3699336.1 hypothetical protein [Clostridioides difficile]
MRLIESTKLFVHVGGGNELNDSKLSYNGGGRGTTSFNVQSNGCGATDIRIGVDDLNHRVIVAGGAGGGLMGRIPQTVGGDYPSGGKQQEAGTHYGSKTLKPRFGVGGGTGGIVCEGVEIYGGGGGGGWYGGGGGFVNDRSFNKFCGGAGGSGYILTADSYKPSGYALTEKYYLTDAITCDPADAGYINHSSDYAHGFARIRLLDEPPTVTLPSSNLGNINKNNDVSLKCTIVVGSESRVNLSLKLNNENISTQSVSNGAHNLIIPKDKLYPLSIGSSNTITVTASNSTGKSTSKTCIFDIINTKPSINISSITDTQTTFTVLDLDNNLNRIEFYLDSTLLETITTDLYLEKTINYTLEDNAIHTVKIKAIDETNEFTEKVVSISKNLMPLQEDFTITDFNNSLSEFKTTFLNGKTSIINTLALKNIEASLNNTLVELSEKIKTSFDSSDASVQDLMNQLTQANNTISQLNSKFKYATGTAYARENSSLIACVYDPNTSHTVTETSPYWLDLNGIGFIPDIFFAECEYEPHSNAFYKYFVFAIKNTFSISNNTGFVVNIAFNKEYGDKSFKLRGALYTLGKRNVSMDNTGVRVPALNTLNDFRAYKWHAIKFK